MPRLGSVLGAILAELGRARVVADHLSRDLVDDYRADPILASMSVPRVMLDHAELTLRFSVSDLTEVEATPTAASLAAKDWARHVASAVLSDVLEKRGLDVDERRATIVRLVRSDETPSLVVPVTVIRDAIAGKYAASSRVTTSAVLEAWGELPREVRTKLGSKAAFRRELEGRLVREVSSFVGRAREIELVKAALASRIDVAIRTEDLPSEPERIQELKLTLRGEDVTLIVQQRADQ